MEYYSDSSSDLDISLVREAAAVGLVFSVYCYTCRHNDIIIIQALPPSVDSAPSFFLRWSEAEYQKCTANTGSNKTVKDFASVSVKKLCEAVGMVKFRTKTWPPPPQNHLQKL